MAQLQALYKFKLFKVLRIQATYNQHGNSQKIKIGHIEFSNSLQTQKLEDPNITNEYAQT